MQVNAADLFVALAKVPPETYADLARAVMGVATSADPLDTARRVAEETARITAIDQAALKLRG